MSENSPGFKLKMIMFSITSRSCILLPSKSIASALKSVNNLLLIFAKTYYENKSKEVSQCQTTFDSLVKLTKQSAQFSQELATFRDNDINLIKGCSNSLNMILHYSALLKYVQTYKCILSDSTCLYGRCIANLQCQ